MNLLDAVLWLWIAVTVATLGWTVSRVRLWLRMVRLQKSRAVAEIIGAIDPEIGRQLDRELGLTDPDILTPEPAPMPVKVPRVPPSTGSYQRRFAMKRGPSGSTYDRSTSRHTQYIDGREVVGFTFDGGTTQHYYMDGRKVTIGRGSPTEEQVPSQSFERVRRYYMRTYYVSGPLR